MKASHSARGVQNHIQTLRNNTSEVWINNTLTLKFNMCASGKAVNVEYHVKDIKSTRTLLTVMMKAHGIEVEEYIEEVVIGD